jgi:hypothetical protein
MPKLFLIPGDTGKRVFVWTALFFVCTQMALSIYLNGWRPELRDPAFGLRLQTLQQRLTENPHAPLILLLGSSRTMNGLAPAHMPSPDNSERSQSLVFNFALPGSGSVRELMTYRRLRTEGVKPDYVLIETWPVLWPEDGAFAERHIIAEDELRWSDLTVLSRYLPGKLELFARTLKGNLAPLVCYRSRLLHAGAGKLLSRDLDRGLTNEDNDWTCIDGTGWLPYRKVPADPDALQREVRKGLLVAAPLLNPLHISPDYDLALRNLLDECRADGVEIALFLMPEHSECRSWYTPQSNALVFDYLRQVSEKYTCPVLDMRSWAPDDSFADFCHLAPHGVEKFSKRFACEVLQPWLSDKAFDRTVLLLNHDEPANINAPNSAPLAPQADSPVRCSR